MTPRKIFWKLEDISRTNLDSNSLLSWITFVILKTFWKISFLQPTTANIAFAKMSKVYCSDTFSIFSIISLFSSIFPQTKFPCCRSLFNFASLPLISEFNLHFQLTKPSSPIWSSYDYLRGLNHLRARFSPALPESFFDFLHRRCRYCRRRIRI